MKLMTEEASDVEIYEVNDQVNVFLAKIEANDFEWQGETIHKLRWYFTVTDEGLWKGKDIQGDTSVSFKAHPECKAYNWATAIAGHEYDPGVEFDTDELTGMRCRILIGHRASKNSDRVFMSVTDVMPPRAAIPQPHNVAVDEAKF